ncbi:hypothetical protein DCAR_0414437 [Daucus carota subsp. sativus]|uniref:Uncharacterized protein n=1 Tax=Daucus carota subsp. sativus TaxID=79200 RepID=A0A175YA99_DAUCS|nr:hypothetical protein DCAR_0414437 [Daucus carota subsp. sativus]
MASSSNYALCSSNQAPCSSNQAQISLANNELFIRSVYNVVTRYQSQGSSIEKMKAFGSIGRRDVAKVEKKIGQNCSATISSVILSNAPDADAVARTAYYSSNIDVPRSSPMDMQSSPMLMLELKILT